MNRVKTFGSDLEFFVFSNTGEFLPAWDLMPGVVQETPVDVGYGYTMFPYNAAVEINTPPYTTGRDLFNGLNQGVRLALNMLEAMHPQVSAENTLRLWRNVVTLTDAQAKHPQAAEVGCAPFFDAYKGQQHLLTVEDLGERRYAGGHIHLGMEQAEENVNKLVVCCDINIRNRLLATRRSMDKARKDHIYGKPGLFRPKPEYPGIEYRSLSNRWIQFPEALTILEEFQQAPSRNFTMAMNQDISMLLPTGEYIEALNAN